MGNARSGFTLVEILVSITILIIIVLLFGQLLATTSQAWAYGHGKANNFTKARAMLELLAQDIQSGVFRADLAAFPSGNPGTGGSPPVWEFYTARPGIPGSGTPSLQLRNVSVVQYSFVVPTNTGGIISNSLSRADFPILWSGSNYAVNLLFGSTTAFTPAQPSSAPATNPPTALANRDTAPGVVAFEVIFIQSDGSLSTTYTPLSTSGVANATPTRAICVSLAVVDDLTIQKMSSSQLTALNTALTTTPVIPATPAHGIKAYWDAYLNGSTMNWGSYPKGLGSGLVTFERYISLPNAP